MTLAEVVSVIQDLADNETLVISEHFVAGSGISELLAAATQGEAMLVGDPSVTIADSGVTVSGHSNVFGVGSEISLTLSDGRTSRSTLTAAMPAGWTLAAGFPALSSMFLGRVELDGAVLRAAAAAGEAAEITVTAGVPALGLTGVSFGVDPDVGELHLAAGLDMLELPGIDWFALRNVSIAFRAIPMMGIHAGEVAAALDLDGVPLDVKIAFPEWGDVWTLTGAFDGLHLGLSALSRLVGSEEIVRALPPSLVEVTDSILLDHFTVEFSPTERSVDSVGVTLRVADTWELTGADASLSDIELSAALIDPFDAASRRVTGSMRCTAQVGGMRLALRGTLDSESGLTLGGTLDPTSVGDLSSAFPDTAKLPDELAELVIQDLEVEVAPQEGTFRLSGRSGSRWQLPLGVGGIGIEDLALTIERTAADGFAGSIGGTAIIGSNAFAVEYVFPGDLIVAGRLPTVNLSALLQDLCGAGTTRDVSVPASLLTAELKDVAFELAPADGRISLAATSPLGRATLTVARERAEGWGFAIGFQPGGGAAFATISPELSVLDDLDLSDSALVVSTLDDVELVLPGSDTGVQVQRGANLYAALDLRGLGADEILGIDEIEVSAAIGTRPQDIELEAMIGGDIRLGDGVVLAEALLRLRPAPADFSLALLGVVHAAVGDAELLFTGGLEVAPRTAVFQGTMEGRWVDPFGFRGVSLAEMAVEVGLSFPPPVPSIGIAGSLQIGDFVGAAAVKFDSAQPTRSMVAVSFNRLYLMDVLRAFCDRAIVDAIPAGLQDTVLDVGFEDVDVYIVPQPTTIGELHFDPGFTLRGRMNLWGFRAAAEMTIDYGTGIYVAAACDPIVLGGIFRLEGTLGRPGPSLLLDLRSGQTPKVDVQGRIELLGLSAETILQISDAGFSFTASGRIFDVFEATVVARGDDLAKGDNFYISVTMRNDLFAYLREQATRAIADAAEGATRELTKAQDDLTQSQAEVNRLNGEIGRMRQIVQNERKRNEQSLKAAEQAVMAEKKKVNGLNKQISAMRTTIERERRRDADRLRAARADITKAQREVNGLQSQINAAHARIRTLRNEIRSWENWYNRLSVWDKAWGWTRLGAETGRRNVEIGAQYSAIGALEASKATANAALELAKQAVRGLEAGAKTFPIDADPRIAGLYALLGTATGALEVAQAGLRAASVLIKTFPVDADPRVASLVVARETASAALTTAKVFLQGVEASVGGLADVGTFIAEAGLGGLIDVKAASFEGQLSAASSGSVVLSVQLVFMGETHDLRLRFNFHDPIAAVRDLVTQILPN